MSGNAGTSVLGFTKASLDAFLDQIGPGSVDAAMRYDALARFEELPARESIRGGRTWKRDLAKLDFSGLAAFGGGNTSLPPAPAGVTIERFSLAKAHHAEAFARAFGVAVDTRDDKFASLALAFAREGAFIDVAPNVQLEEPLVIEYDAADAAFFPYTLVAAGQGARFVVVERFLATGAAPFVCSIAEFVLAPNAAVTYAMEQRLPASGRIIATRRALLQSGATLDAALAELGADHAVTRVRVTEAGDGAAANLTALFFSDGEQHVDVETETRHIAQHTTSNTVVRTAGKDKGQGRYFGNIKILPAAHGTDASLRDDALLLSEGAHVDSVPALEIAANDVKAFHGATVGAISEEELFYAQSRGIARADAERMIALGFFEPAVSRFPGETLREGIRAALEAKLAGEPAA